MGKSYGIDVIVQGISAIVNENDRIGIIGENGAGKTTLLNMLMGILENDEGDIIVADNVTIGYLKQTDGLNPNNTLYSEMETVFAEVFKAVKELELVEKKLTIDPDDADLIEKYHIFQRRIQYRFSDKKDAQWYGLYRRRTQQNGWCFIRG